MMINIDELHRKQYDKVKKKIEAFQEVLRICQQHIKKHAEDTNECYCSYVIPQMVYGYPLYDINSCILYLVEKLVDNGFKVLYTHPNLLLISWYKQNKVVVPGSNTKSIEPPKKKEIEYRTTNDYQPSNNFIYDQSSVESLKNKANRLLFDNTF